MPDLATKQYLAIVQCDIVMQRCSGYFCEKALHERTGGFAVYPAEQSLRHVMLDLLDEVERLRAQLRRAGLGD